MPGVPGVNDLLMVEGHVLLVLRPRLQRLVTEN